MYQQTVLVAEDSDDLRALMKTVLQMKGYRVTEAADGRQAVESALLEHPDLILMDLSMPVMDGWEATRQLRRYELTREVPIVAVSAHCREEQRELAIRAGCDEYIPKPVDYEALDRVLAKLLVIH
jgi:two-component system cell cycle response regulator DivK